MTYKEAYMKCNTLAELEKEIEKDVAIARMLNPDRLRFIKAAGEEVANLKFGKEEQP